jgi:hypothetical protein
MDEYLPAKEGVTIWLAKVGPGSSLFGALGTDETCPKTFACTKDTNANARITATPG